MEEMKFYNLIRYDYGKYKKYGGNFISILFFTQGFWAIIQYRVANEIYRKVNISIVKKILLFICLIWQKVIEISTGISIPASANIGHSFYIGHFGGIILNSLTIIGNNCNIAQGVTIGISGRGEKRGVPVIGNNVFIAANAVIAGKINVGNNCVIGANSLVVTNVPNAITVVGVPAVKISDNNSDDYI